MLTLITVILLALFGAAGFHIRANGLWPVIVSVSILFVAVPLLTYNGLQQTEEGRLILVVPLLLGALSLGMLTGWAFGKPNR